MEQDLFTVTAHIVKGASVVSAVRKFAFMECYREIPPMQSLSTRGWGRWHLSGSLIQPCESYIRHINFLHYTAASKKQQVKSGSSVVLNGNILSSRSHDFKCSHQNSKNCHGWGKQDNSAQIILFQSITVAGKNMGFVGASKIQLCRKVESLKKGHKSLSVNELRKHLTVAEKQSVASDQFTYSRHYCPALIIVISAFN